MKNKIIDPWGYHLILNCSGCDHELINDKKNIALFLDILLKKIDMIPCKDPIIEFLLPETNNEGYSFIQMITTSHIAGHFVNKDNTGYIDIFSCKNFDVSSVLLCVNQFFRTSNVNQSYLLRRAN